MNQAGGIGKFKCERCIIYFDSESQLTAHKKKSSLQGNLCHLEIHKVKVKKKFECEKCTKEFSLKKNYTRHVENSLKEGIDKYTCDECQKAFALSLHWLNTWSLSIKEVGMMEMSRLKSML